MERIALVTGAGRRIGRAIALAFARQGTGVVLLGRTEAELEAVAAEVRAAGARALVAVADVTLDHQVEVAVARALAELGRIDILVNNAGINEPGRIEEQPPEVWWNIVQTSLGGTYRLSRAVVPSMVRQRWGRVINIASRQAKVGAAYATAYCAAKHAVLGLTRALALEVAESGVTVNAVCPGMVQISDRYWGKLSAVTGTPADELKRRALAAAPQKQELVPEDVAGAVLFLASDAAARITGDAMNVSGGLVMH